MSVGDGAEAQPTISDWLVLALRAFAEPEFASKATWPSTPRPKPSDWVLIFDCETKTTPDQRLRFGAYQVRYRGRLWERGVFYDPPGLAPEEIQTLERFMLTERPSIDGERIFMRTRAAFVENVFFRQAYRVGAQIVGFNLPFDISRLAIGHVNAKGHMKGGFSFTLSPSRRRPRVAVKHLSARTSFFEFKGASMGKQPAGAGRTRTDRGYFVDLKALAGTLTSQSHSLASLTKLLGVPTEKRPADDHDAPLSEDYIRYALRDVQATWECFDVLAKRVEGFNLPDVGLYELYSEASLGKAYLKAMGVRTWRETQPDFPRDQLGQIMSAYFGGRAEVHIRREIVEVIHCDFLSMYPTVCTLMGLWDFVIADGVTWTDATDDVRNLVRDIEASDLQAKSAWRGLTTLVQVQPDSDILPVRARYSDALTPNIGLNYLSADEGLWFTLADVIASKILSGKTPEILTAIRYAPGTRQSGLQSASVAHKPFDPAQGDFYRDLIDHRSEVKRQAKQPDADRARLDAEQLAIKILANSTSYGIFMELNVEDRAKAGPMKAYGARPDPLSFDSKTLEKPGRYFHPLLGTLITGAARLMLALAEHQVIARGLDWAFCDTDSIAIANTPNLPRQEFEDRALAVQAWFDDLNPYREPNPVLKVEDVNYAEHQDGGALRMEPLYCLAVSAKRYVQFNRSADGEPIVRKASGHGLGHLMDPTQVAPEINADWVKRVGAPRWQVELWKEIILATDAGRPDVVRLDLLAGFDGPALSQYAATTPDLLSWFDAYNDGKPYEHQVRPFNFLLSLQHRSDIDLASEDADALADRGKAQPPRPAAPFTRDPREAATTAFDRVTGKQVPPEVLKTLGRSLVRYHLHSEAKFLGGEDNSAGLLQRRHVKALAVLSIGKEADALAERLFVGEGDADIAYPIDERDFPRLFGHAWSLQTELGVSDRDLAAKAKISHHTLAKLRRSGGSVEDATRLVQTMESFRREREERSQWDADLVRSAQALADELGGVSNLAKTVGMTRQYVGRILRGERPVSDQFARAIGQFSAATRART